MNILAVDTATQYCSVAVTDRDLLLSEITILGRKTHSGHLLSLIEQALDRAGLNIQDIDGYCATTGPGSFTGLRIGIATVKGLALAARKPVAGVSNFDAAVYPFACAGIPVFCLLDARRKEVYFCRYGNTKGTFEKESIEQTLPPEQVPAHMDGPALFVGNGALIYKDLILSKAGHPAFFAPPASNTVRAAAAAALAFKRFSDGDTDAVATLTPHYIRKSDAELNFEKPKKLA